jgi:hypothetical protein
MAGNGATPESAPSHSLNDHPFSQDVPRLLETIFPTCEVGKAERLAFRKRQPNAFLQAEAHTHF